MTPQAANISTQNDDLRDAGIIFDMIKYFQENCQNYRTAQQRSIIRNLVDKFWDKPRETKQGHRKRAANALWSPEAYKSTYPEEKTIGEHVYPMNLRINTWFDNFELLSANRIATDLRNDPRTVITTKQNAELQGRLKNKMPVGWDEVNLWARYDARDPLKDRSNWKTFTAWQNG